MSVIIFSLLKLTSSTLLQAEWMMCSCSKDAFPGLKAPAGISMGTIAISLTMSTNNPGLLKLLAGYVNSKVDTLHLHGNAVPGGCGITVSR